MGNLEIYERVRSVPAEAQRKINGGRLNGKTDINPMWRIKVLTEQFGPCGIGWYYEVTKQWTENQGEETAAFVNILLYVKAGGEWSKPIFGTGGSMFAEKQKSGLYVSDECYKMATTDAISVACKQLGIGADVYWDKDKTKYTEKRPAKPADTQTAPGQDARLAPVLQELHRIGYTVNAICKTYKIDSISDMSDLQIKDFLQRAKKMPDKEPA